LTCSPFYMDWLVGKYQKMGNFKGAKMVEKVPKLGKVPKFLRD